MNDHTMEVNEAGDDDLEENTTKFLLVILNESIILFVLRMHTKCNWSLTKDPTAATNVWKCSEKGGGGGDKQLVSYLQ
jgi:hypothetical protein